MFGLVYLITNLLGVAISGGKRSIENSHFKEQGWKRYNNKTDLGRHTYYDGEGRERDLTSNDIMFTYKKDGDLYIENTKTFEVRNLTEEKNTLEIKEIKNSNPNLIAIFYKNWSHNQSGLKDSSGCGIPGKVFKDINTGELYFERYITWRKTDFSKAGIRGDYCGAYFYIKISDGKIVSISDLQIEENRENNCNEKYDDFISFFNSEQEKGGFVLRNRNKYAKGRDDFYIANYNTCNK